MSSEQLHTVLRQFRRAIERIYGERLINMILFGSQARGDAQDGSDIDLLIVLQGPVDPNAEIERLSPVKARICLEHNVAISCVYFDAVEVREGESPLLRNVRREGVPV
ncbi:MAG: nucleotidyltransferase domain-containing protein [Bryobacterales bacterium]|nr:nucleotidyltransferase domain-containing protein [Bryobacterales bacterium]